MYRERKDIKNIDNFNAKIGYFTDKFDLFLTFKSPGLEKGNAKSTIRTFLIIFSRNDILICTNLTFFALNMVYDPRGKCARRVFFQHF